MIINAEYKKELILKIGKRAENWFEKLPDIIDKCTVKWKLSELKAYENLTYNYVCSAKSEIFGDVVLKAGFPHKELYTEMDSLKDFKKDVICDIYDSCMDLNVMLLEQLSPGHTLWSIKDNEEKVRLAAPVINNLATKITDTSKYPYHYDWVRKSFKYIRENVSDNLSIDIHMEYVEKIYDDLDFEGNDKLLLHGDLHHANIISNNLSWKAIDPKGVVGFKSLEVGRFIRNQYNTVAFDKRDAALDYMLKVFSKELGYDELVILKSFYIDLVLTYSWYFDEDTVNVKEIKKGILECDEVLKKLKLSL